MLVGWTSTATDPAEWTSPVEWCLCTPWAGSHLHLLRRGGPNAEIGSLLGGLMTSCDSAKLVKLNDGWQVWSGMGSSAKPRKRICRSKYVSQIQKLTTALVSFLRDDTSTTLAHWWTQFHSISLDFIVVAITCYDNHYLCKTMSISYHHPC
jgi:hypothetical protein